MFVDDLSEVKSCVVVAPLVLDRTLVVAAVRLVRLLQVKRDEKKTTKNYDLPQSDKINEG
jgi:hypothetical protein